MVGTIALFIGDSRHITVIRGRGQSLLLGVRNVTPNVTPLSADPPPARRYRLWAEPITRALRRASAPVALPARVVAAVAEAPGDDGDDLLRRLREAGL